MIVYYKYRTKFSPKMHGWYQCDRDDLQAFLRHVKSLYVTRLDVKIKKPDMAGKRLEFWRWTPDIGWDGKRGWRKLEPMKDYPYTPPADPCARKLAYNATAAERAAYKAAEDAVFGSNDDWLVRLINEVIFDK